MEATEEVLTEEELSSYKSAHESFKHAEAELAHNTSEQAIIESRQKSALMNYSQSIGRLNEEQIKLTEKYGDDIRIDLMSGRIIRDGDNS